MMRPFMYHGFRVTIFNNGNCSFKYEWKIEAVSQQARAILLRNWKKDKLRSLIDNTSSRKALHAKWRALCTVNEIRNISWSKGWHR